MKNIIALLLALLTYSTVYAQCPARTHKLSGHYSPVSLLQGQHDKTDYTEEDMCDYDGWVLAWAEEFNEPGSKLNEAPY